MRSLILLGLASLVFVHQSRFDTPSPISRLDALHACFSRFDFEIDLWRTNTPDVAFARCHYFSDKAPGTLLLAAPGFALGNAATAAAKIPLESKKGWLLTSWAACTGIGVVTAFGLACFAMTLSALAGSRAGALTAATVWFGAAPLPYSTLLFSHAHVVACIGLGLHFLHKSQPAVFGPLWRGRNLAKRTPSLIFAGFVFGWALNSEYTAGLVVVGILMALIGASLRDYGWIGIGMSGPLLLIPVYSWLTIGSPFALPYTFQASFPEMKEGLYAIKWPDASTAWKLLFSSARGLFFWSPFLVCAFLGYPELMRRAPRVFWVCYLVPILHIAVISGRVWDWPAGPTLGPRYLAPILPLLAFPCAFGVRRFPKIGIALASYSILITTLATLTDACPDFSSHPNPLFDLHLALFLQGKFSPNLGMAAGLPPYVSVALFYVILAAAIWSLFKYTGRSVRTPNGECGTRNEEEGGSHETGRLSQPCLPGE